MSPEVQAAIISGAIVALVNVAVLAYWCGQRKGELAQLMGALFDDDRNSKIELLRLSTETHLTKIDLTLNNGIVSEVKNLREESHTFQRNVHEEIHALQTKMKGCPVRRTDRGGQDG